jgi:putative endonuclease
MSKPGEIEFEEAFPPTSEQIARNDRARALGQKGEDLACHYLWKRGFRILERNYRFGKAEIDIIAEREGRIRFVEVKTRSSDSLGEPEERIDEEKISHLREAAQGYLSRFPDPPERGVQFDAVTLKIDPFGRVQSCEHLEDRI